MSASLTGIRESNQKDALLRAVIALILTSGLRDSIRRELIADIEKAYEIDAELILGNEK